MRFFKKLTHSKAPIGVICVFVACFSVILFGKSASAIVPAGIDQITARAKVADLAKCSSFFGDVIDINKLKKPSDILNSGGRSDSIALPTGVEGGGVLFSCATLLDNYMGYSFNENDIEKKSQFLTNLGYSVDDSFGRKCNTYTIKESGGAEQKITVCANLNNSNINGVDVSYDKGFIIQFGPIEQTGSNSYRIPIYPPESSNPVYAEYNTSDVDSLFNAIDRVLNEQVNPVGGYSYTKESGAGMSGNQNAENGVYRKGSLPLEMSTQFNSAERIGLLYFYFKTFGETKCYWTEGARKVNLNSTDYYVMQAAEAPSSYFMISGSSWFKVGTWDDVLNELESAGNIDGMQSCEGEEPPAAGEAEGSDEDACFNGANSLGWIVCPIITALRNTLETIYDEIITPFLQINVSAFNMDGNGVYAGWQVFQGFANIAFVILLLVVIFSQVTGIGIDNLGIKRILPKLIIAAVLINLSYIICQLLVDVSNIAGYGLRNLFEGIEISGESAGTGQGILTTAISGAIAAGTVAGAAYTVPMWGQAIILPLLLGLIGILISVLFMFVLLGVRQAGVIILVVVSPLAFVMYMLPNTKNIFQRWWKALTALLLLFPICGAMIGGSALAGKILASTSTGFWTNLLAALLTVIPFFFVPTLLKGSFSALGNIGAKISGIGQRMAGGIGKVAGEGVKRTGVFRNIQANAQDRQEIKNRVAERRRLEGISSRIGGLAENMRTPEQRRQFMEAQNKLNKMDAEDAEAEVGTARKDMDLLRTTFRTKRFNEDVEAIKARNVSDGTVNRIGEVDGEAFDGTGNGFTENTLAHALYNAKSDQEIYAITSQLMASGHHGAEALHQVMAALGNDGNSAALATIAAAAKGDNKLGELKAGARSTYDYINDLAEGKIQGGAEGSGTNIEDYAGKVKWGGMSEQQLIGTDKEELRRYRDIITDKRARMARGENVKFTEQEQKLISQANAAWSNDRIRGSAKKDVQDIVSQIAYGEVRQPGQTGGNASEGESFDVRGGEEPQDEATEAMQQAQSEVNEQNIQARERAQREETRRYQESLGMDDATFSYMQAQQGVNEDRRRNSASFEAARQARRAREASDRSNQNQNTPSQSDNRQQ